MLRINQFRGRKSLDFKSLLFPCVFPFDFPLAIMHHPLDQRIFLSLVVRETTSPRVIGFASDSIRHRCAFHVKSFQGFLIPAYTLLLSFSSLFFFIRNLPHDLIRFLLKSSGTARTAMIHFLSFSLFLIQGDFGRSFYRILWRMPEEMTGQVVVNS